jgi:hypothetical protein
MFSRSGGWKFRVLRGRGVIGGGVGGRGEALPFDGLDPYGSLLTA